MVVMRDQIVQKHEHQNSLERAKMSTGPICSANLNMYVDNRILTLLSPTVISALIMISQCLTMGAVQRSAVPERWVTDCACG